LDFGRTSIGLWSNTDQALGRLKIHLAGYSNQFSQGFRLHFVHNPGALYLNCFFARARFRGDIQREATSFEVSEMRKDNEQIKQLAAELLLKNRVLKKV